MSDAEVATDAGKTPEPGYTIYPVNGDTCPGTPFPPGLEVLPTRICPGAGGPCHDEVCHNDADCPERPRGHCAGTGEGDGAIENTRCIYEQCETNADCERGMACLCGRGWRFCAKADCIADGDCPTGEHCIPIDAECSGGPFLVCTSPADQCHTASDCPGEGACLASDHDTPLVCATVICGE